MKHSILTLYLSALALAGSGVALAQAQPTSQAQPVERGERTITLAAMQERGERMSARMDVNGDGVLDQADRAARQADRFAKLDADGDGEVSRAEIEAAREAHAEQRRERRAARLTARQDTGRADRFATLDTDGSGGLSQDEWTAAQAKRGDRSGAETRARPERRTAMRGRMMARGMMCDADADGNRAVTRAEFDAALQQRFARMDRDGDGTVTAAERKAARDAMREARRQRRAQG